ncbi:hypothetical protein [Pallidibacillus thermolactis]|jgi:hypothetical protein|uniref:hypothetical protein n=1 Tax=Pallidibacillus thermolactis TaxID=251051 RepID=UPI002E24833F|nr:hypothetical protein [Pallidibacillus thermolactis subsp. kokeshiiformis]
MVKKTLRVYNEQESNAFRVLFESEEFCNNRLYESAACKLFRHEYCYVDNGLVDQIMNWFSRCGLKVRVAKKESYQTMIELV